VRAHVARIAAFPIALALSSRAAPLQAQSIPPTAAERSAPVSFHIQAQPLEKALVAYGLATQIQVLYEARLVAGRQSTAVEGGFAPEEALDILLRGTGLHVRYVTAGTITLAADATPSRDVLVMRTVQIQAPDGPRDAHRFDPFGQSLEQRMLQALRQDPRTRRRPFDATVKVWLGPNGGVVRSDIVGDSKPDDRAAIADVLLGVGAGQPPPGLPQPVSFHFQSKPAY
jgi:hypothetical protein